MDGQLHLHLDGRKLALRGGGTGPAFAAHRGLVDAGEQDHATRGGCADDGRVVTGQVRGAAAPPGPRQSVSTIASTFRSCWTPKASQAA